MLDFATVALKRFARVLSLAAAGRVTNASIVATLAARTASILASKALLQDVPHKKRDMGADAANA